MRVLLLAATLDETNGWGRYAAGFVRQAQQRHGAANVIVPNPARLLSKQISPMQPLLACLDAARLCRLARTCDGIHVLTEPLAPLAMLLALFCSRPYVVSIAGTYGALASFPRSIRWLYRWAYDRATHLSVLSRYTRSVVQRDFPDAPMTIVYGGFDPPDSQPELRVRHRSSAPRLLSVGALKPRKGFHTLVAALRRLTDEGMALQCDIVGPSSASNYEANLRSAIAEGNLQGSVHIRGKVAQEELDRLYASADLFVLPSEHVGTAFEGLGLVYLEALAHGTPVIGCLESGAEDVVEDGKNGRLVPPGDAATLALAIREILSDEPRWQALVAAARPSIDKFRWERVGTEMHDLYVATFGGGP